MEEFKKLSSHRIKLLSNEERTEYQKQAIIYYGNLKNQLRNYKVKGVFHPLIVSFLKLYPVKIIKLNDFSWPKDKGPVIFSANHSNSKDFPTLVRLIKQHFFIMADYTMINDKLVNSLNKLNGCVYVDRLSKESGKNAFRECVDGINSGYNMLLFPEGTWNLLNKEPMLPRRWGDIKIAQATSRPILPIALVYSGKKCFVKFGQLTYVDKNDDLKIIDNQLYNEMSKLRNDIWNSVIYQNNCIDISYEKWLKDTINSYKYFDVEYETSVIRKSDDYLKEQFDYILRVGEELRPKHEIEKRLVKSKINYRLK